jgi:hypothetical protein
MSEDRLSARVSVNTQRINDHEKVCAERMIEVRDTFKEVKTMIEQINTRLFNLILGVGSTAVILLIGIVLAALKLK